MHPVRILMGVYAKFISIYVLVLKSNIKLMITSDGVKKIDVAGLKIAVATKSDFLSQILLRIKANQKTWVITPYSEFLYHALRNKQLMETLNQADFAVADGIGIFWAKKYLEIPLTAKNYYTKIIQGLWQIKYSLWAIVFNPKWIKSLPPEPSFAKATEDSRYLKNISWEKIPGSELVWDLAKLASENNLSIFLLGGFGNTPELVAKKLISKFPNIIISGTSTKNSDDATVTEDIKKASPDMLLVAYGPIKQERWIASNLPNLPVKLAIGLGGTFDYLAGKVPLPPKIMRAVGLEWLWRLFTQPKRVGRIFNATFGLISEVLLYKVFQYLPYRKNVVGVIIKNKNLVFIAQRNPNNKKGNDRNEDKNKYLDYWQLPQGGIGNEEMIVAARREVAEETGIKSLKFLKISGATHTYNFSSSWFRLFGKEYRFKGQTQSIAYFEFTGDDSEIHLDNDELINWRWVDIDQLKNSIHPERQLLTEIVFKDLKETQEKAII